MLKTSDVLVVSGQMSADFPFFNFLVAFLTWSSVIGFKLTSTVTGSSSPNWHPLWLVLPLQTDIHCDWSFLFKLTSTVTGSSSPNWHPLWLVLPLQTDIHCDWFFLSRLTSTVTGSSSPNWHPLWLVLPLQTDIHCDWSFLFRLTSTVTGSSSPNWHPLWLVLPLQSCVLIQVLGSLGPVASADAISESAVTSRGFLCAFYSN